METVIYPFVYAWGNNSLRATLKGRSCRVVAKGALRSVLVEFDNGQRVVTSERALRKRDGIKLQPGPPVFW